MAMGSIDAGFVEPLAQLGGARQPGERDCQRVSASEQLAHRCAAEALRGDDQLLRAVAAPGELGDDGFEIVDETQHRHAVDLAADPRPGVRQHADDTVDALTVAQRLADKGVGAVARADQQHRHDLRPGRAFENVIEPAILEQPIAETRRAKQRDQHQPVDEQCRARQRIQPGEDEHHRQHDQHRQARRLGDAEQIGQRGVAPDAAIKPGEQKDDRRHRGEHRTIDERHPWLVRERVVAEPQVERDRERQRRDHDVVQKGEQRSARIG